ncbi:hypothetical protein [Ferviditalea candida]|uniref:Uncharacterized protein n=1 Tax=Ferviditalea candida TaxID=3108399 RepID=A0ABU5ZK57_9BACL|nr:hypothetical protein [Paenibacillaceae bacterium T2]
MSDQVRIEPKGGKFAVVLEHGGSTQEMDVRNTYRDAEEFAFYVARRVKLDVYFKGQKLDGRNG